jgi:hypothetical protein
MLITIGIIITTVPVLLINAPTDAVTSIIRKKSLVSFVPARAITLVPTILARPVRNIAAPTTNRAIINIVTGWEKPAKASLGDIMPVRVSVNNPIRATISALGRPMINRTITEKRIMSVIYIGSSIVLEL